MTNQSGDPLLQPLQLKHLTLRNRIMSTAHACGLEDRDAMPGEVYQAYHEAKARGGLALSGLAETPAARAIMSSPTRCLSAR